MKTVTVTVQITEHDYEHMVRHFASGEIGFPIVQVFQPVSVPLMGYQVVIERGATSWGASVPDLPGCVAVGETQAEVLALIREAIDAHVADLRTEEK